MTRSSLPLQRTTGTVVPKLLSNTETNGAAVNPIILTQTAAAGTMAVAIVHLATGATTNNTSMVDASSNTWTQQATTVLTAVNSRMLIFTAPILTALSAASVTISTTAAYKFTVNISIWSGVGSVKAGGGTVTTSGATTAPPACTIASVGPYDLVIGGISYNNATAPSALGGGFLPLTGNTPAAIAYYGANAYQIPEVAGTYGPAWTTPSSSSASATVVLRPGSIN